MITAAASGPLKPECADGSLPSDRPWKNAASVAGDLFDVLVERIRRRCGSIRIA